MLSCDTAHELIRPLKNLAFSLLCESRALLNAFVPKYFRIFKAICSLFLRLQHRRRMELEDKA